MNYRNLNELFTYMCHLRVYMCIYVNCTYAVLHEFHYSKLAAVLWYIVLYTMYTMYTMELVQ